MNNMTGRMPTRGNPSRIPQIVEINDTDPLSGYRISDRDNNGTNGFNYYGYLKKDGSYYIMREEIAIGAYRYVKGTTDYSTIWSARVSQVYDYFNVIFS